MSLTEINTSSGQTAARFISTRGFRFLCCSGVALGLLGSILALEPGPMFMEANQASPRLPAESGSTFVVSYVQDGRLCLAHKAAGLGSPDRKVLMEQSSVQSLDLLACDSSSGVCFFIGGTEKNLYTWQSGMKRPQLFMMRSELLPGRPALVPRGGASFYKGCYYFTAADDSGEIVPEIFWVRITDQVSAPHGSVKVAGNPTAKDFKGMGKVGDIAIHAASGRAWGVSLHSNGHLMLWSVSITEKSGQMRLIADMGVAADQPQITFDAMDRLWISGLQAHSLSLVDSESGAVIQTVALNEGFRPADLAPNCPVKPPLITASGKEPRDVSLRDSEKNPQDIVMRAQPDSSVSDSSDDYRIGGAPSLAGGGLVGWGGGVSATPPKKLPRVNYHPPAQGTDMSPSNAEFRRNK